MERAISKSRATVIVGKTKTIKVTGLSKCKLKKVKWSTSREYRRLSYEEGNTAEGGIR